MFKNFNQLVIHAVTQHLNKTAIFFHDKAISYHELNQRANDLAHHLIKLGATPSQIIPCILERDPETIVSMIAILKIGCAFLPISPITPCDRVRFILEDTQAKFLITNITVEHLISSEIKVVRRCDIQPSCQEPLVEITEKQLAYVMYTSGTTGRPKGVLIEQGSMMNLFSCLLSEFNLTESDFVFALTDYTFDISLIELLMPLLCGATILLTEQGTVADGGKIRSYLKKNEITFMQATPLTWEILLKQGWENNGKMKILVGGEKFKTRLAIQLEYKKENIWNMYGPTETSMWSMMNPIKSILTTKSVPLGIPLKNTQIEILDDQLNRVKTGVQGELFIGGGGLARGYLNDLKLTNEKFIQHPLTKKRLYKTGDLVIANAAQEICYIGRVDDQLKFGGIRIESGEIENVIEQEPFVKKAVVKVHETENYYKSLAAYIEVDEEKIFSEHIHPEGTDISCFLRNIYDETYAHAEEYEHGKINNCGWQSSFTGQILGVDELTESYRFIKRFIQESLLSDVLEIGCGAGSLLLEYIDKAQECTIVEISHKAIEYVNSRLTKDQRKKICFKNESAINVHYHQKFSCIILNSVIQYFPSIHYLVTTLTQLIRACKPNGVIMIGDVRSLELMDIYLLEKMRTNSANDEELQLNVNTYYYKSRDTEIALSPSFFYALQTVYPEISHVDISVKHGIYRNELNYFRYDAVLYINKPVEYQLPVIVPYDHSLTESSVIDLLQSNLEAPLILCNIPNLYVHELLANMNKNISQHIVAPKPLQKIHLNAEQKRLIHSLMAYESDFHEKFVHYDATDPIHLLEIHFVPKSKHHLQRVLNQGEYKNYRTYCREPFNPWLQKFCFDHVKLKVSQQVVSWVHPSVYVWIEKWPHSINGKLDRKKLKLPLGPEVMGEDASLLQQLQIIWRNITGDNAIVDKEFWIHGVSSLCMYFFLATINETFLVNINYHEFHEYSTLEKLERYLSKLLDINQKNKAPEQIESQPIHDSYKTYLNAIVNNLPGAVYWKDREGRYLGCNKFVAEMAGYDHPEELLGKTDYDLCWREFANDWQQLDNKVMIENTTIVHEEKAKLADGRIIIELTYKCPLKNDQGETIGIIGTSLDITNQKNLEADLLKAKEAAETANKAKTDFIANMSHDIRTPLTGIIGLSSMIEEGAHNAEEKRNAHWLHESGEQLLGLLNGILEVVSAEHVREDEVHESSFDLRQCIEDIVQLEQPTVQLKHLDLQVEMDGDVPVEIISDRTKLHRILLNLLGNAIKFTQTGQVTIHVGRIKESASALHLKFSVADTGIGIPAALQEKVFDRFYRVTPSYQGTYAGHGVGLHIAQSYVRLLGGHITLTSQEGRGTTFHFDLPCKVGASRETTKPAERVAIAVELEKNAPYVLLVEDNPIASSVIEAMTTQAGCRFESASDGAEALALAKATDFDCIITDLGLPVLSGHDFTKQLRAWEAKTHRKRTPIIGLTAHARGDALQECLACGMDEVYTKPAEAPMIQAVLTRFVSKKKAPTPEPKQSKSPLGLDLPNTEKALFELARFAVFDPKYGLQHIPDISLMLKLLQTLVSEVGQVDIQDMQAAYNQKDWTTIERLAHKIKGGATYLGTHRLKFACQYLERYHKAGHSARLEELYHQAMTVNQETVEDVREWLRVYAIK